MVEEVVLLAVEAHQAVEEGREVRDQPRAESDPGGGGYRLDVLGLKARQEAIQGARGARVHRRTPR